jgi:hypothetical protein
MQPHASSPLSLAHTRIDDPEKGPSPAFSPGEKSRFHEAFARANRAMPATQAAPPAALEGSRKAAARDPVESARSSNRDERASTARRPERAQRQRADAGTERRPEAETAERADTANASRIEGETTRGAEVDGEEGPRNEAPIRSDLLAFLQTVTSPVVLVESPLTLGAPLAGAPSEGGAFEAIGAKLGEGATALGSGGTLAEAGHTSEATLNHLADAFARADRLHAQSDATALEGQGALSTEGMQLSNAARALLEGRPAEGAAAQALATGHAHAAKGDAQLKGPTVDGAKTAEATSVDGALTAATSAADPAGARSQGDLGRDEGSSQSGEERLGRDSFASSFSRAEDVASSTSPHGAFGADPRVQSAFDAKASPEARLEQAKAASEHILERIERLTEQRAAGREMVIATERGPVRVRVDVAEKNVSVHFRADDDQLKNLLRSGLPALQATLAKRGFGSTDFQFDGESANDLMANGGGSKHAEARAIRESLLGEAMVEPVNLEGAKVASRDPRALLSVTA